MANFFDDYLDKIKSFSYGKLILAIHSDPLLLYEDKLKEKIEECSRRLRGWVESTDQESKGHERRTKAHKTLLICHLCPWLIRSKEFSWLFQDVCTLVSNSLHSSKAFKEYWEALKSVKGEFITTKANEPELPFKVFGALIEQINVRTDKLRHHKGTWAVKVLKGLYEHHDDPHYPLNLSLKLPLGIEIIDEELKRLAELIERHSKNKQIPPVEFIEKNHRMIVDKIHMDKNSNKKFWNHMLMGKQFLKEEKEISPQVKKEVLGIYKEEMRKQKRQMSERTMRRHLKYVNDLWKKSEIYP